jgi:hypothetical protein
VREEEKRGRMLRRRCPLGLEREGEKFRSESNWGGGRGRGEEVSSRASKVSVGGDTTAFFHSSHLFSSDLAPVLVLSPFETGAMTRLRLSAATLLVVALALGE